MADNTVLNSGTGGDTFRTLEDSGAVKWPVGVTAFATSVGTPDALSIVAPTAGLPVHQQTGATWAVSMSAVPTGAATAANQATEITALGSIATLLGGTLGVSIVGQTGAVTISDGGGSVTVDGTATVTQSGTWTVGLSAAQTLATVTTVGTVTNLSQMGGAAIAMGTGARTAGTQRVTIATDDVVPASQSGTWTVQPGNTPNTTAWLVSDRPATSGGLTMHKTVSAASTNATSVKASAGQVYDVQLFNTNAAARYLKLYNKASAPTVGTDTPVKTLLLPGNTAGGGVVKGWEKGLEFATGIAFAITTGMADADTGAVGSAECIVNIDYK